MHYYASSVFTWAVARERQEAVKKVAQDAPSTAFPLEVVSCKVYADIRAPYKMNYYMPVGVEISDVEKWLVKSRRSKPILLLIDED